MNKLVSILCLLFTFSANIICGQNPDLNRARRLLKEGKCADAIRYIKQDSCNYPEPEYILERNALKDSVQRCIDSQSQKRIPNAGEREKGTGINKDSITTTKPPVITTKEITETGTGFDYYLHEAIELATDNAEERLKKRGFTLEEVKGREIINTKIDTLANGINATVTIKINIKSN